MAENETVQRELKSATASYHNIPIWMKRIEKKMNSSKRQGKAQHPSVTANSDAQSVETDRVPIVRI